MIIGLLGFAGSGKGTAADILVSKGFVKESFADPVKDAVAAIFGWERTLLEGDTKESRDFREKRDEFWSDKFGYEVTPRYMLQLMGTEAGRDTFNKDLWIHSLEQRANRNKFTVVADVRFPNECDFIRRVNGFIVRVVRGPEPEWFDHALHDNAYRSNEKMGNYYPNIHYSEWAWIGQKTDYVLTNNGTFDMLEADIKHMLKTFIGTDVMKTKMVA